MIRVNLTIKRSVRCYIHSTEFSASIFIARKIDWRLQYSQNLKSIRALVRFLPLAFAADPITIPHGEEQNGIPFNVNINYLF